MCIKVITHTLVCDRRAVIIEQDDNGVMPFINPYAAPTPCACAPDKTRTKLRLQCDTHGCCMKTARLLACTEPRPCADPTEYHRYIRVKPLPAIVSTGSMKDPDERHRFGYDETCEDCNPDGFAAAAAAAAAASQQAAKQAPKPAAPKGAWTPLPTLDPHIGASRPPGGGAAARPSAAFGAARAQLARHGHASVALLVGLRAAEAEAGACRQAFESGAHAACRRVLLEGECPAERDLNRARAARARLARELRLAQDLFRSWKAVLFLLQARGQGEIRGLDAYRSRPAFWLG